MAVSLSDSPSLGPNCPICYSDYSDSNPDLVPRILQCGHTYCTQCLEKLLTIEPDEDDFTQMILSIRHTGTGWRTVRTFPSGPRRGSGARASNELKCPTCNSMIRIRNGNVSNLTKNFALLSVKSETVSQKPKSRHYCNDHDHEKRLYCQDDKVLICAYCQLFGEHKGHNCVIATEVAEPAVEAVRTAEANVSSDLEQVVQAEEQVDAVVQKLHRGRRRCEILVKRYFGRLIKSLEGKEEELLSGLRNWNDEQLYILQAQLDALKGAKKDCDTVFSDCRSLIEGDPVDALVQHEEIVEGVSSLHERVAGLSFYPLINPTVRCTVSGNEEELLSDLMENCRVVYNSDTQGEEDEGRESKSENESEGEEDSMQAEGAAGYKVPGASPSEEEASGKSQKGIYSQDTQDPAAVPNYFAGSLPKLALEPWLFGSRPQPQTEFSFPVCEQDRSSPPKLEPAQDTNPGNMIFVNPTDATRRYTGLFQLGPSRQDSDSNSDTENDSPHAPFIFTGHTRLSEDYFPHGTSVIDSLELQRRLGTRRSSDDEGSNMGIPHSCSGGLGLFPREPDSTRSVDYDDDPISSPEGFPQQVNLDSNSDDEIVLPLGQQYSWSTNMSNGHSFMVDIGPHGTSVQLSIQAPSNVNTVDMDLTDTDDQEVDEV